MKIQMIDAPDFFLKPVSRSLQFVMNTIFIACDVLMIIIMLVKRSGSLPFTTSLALVFAIILLGIWWRTVYRRHESLALLLRSREELSSNPTILPLLRANEELIQRGLQMTALITFMFMMAFLGLFR
jgi:hypothetical protein